MSSPAFHKDQWSWRWRASYFIIIRFLLVMMPQTGYIHPDEFFQSSEVMASDILGFDTLRPWEFNTTLPVRSIVFPYLTAGLPFLFVQSCFGESASHSIVVSYLLLVLPRLVMALLSLVNDWCLLKLCNMYQKNAAKHLVVYGSSVVCLVFYTRTLGNSLEAMFLSLLIYQVGSAIRTLTDSNGTNMPSRKQCQRNHTIDDLPGGNTIAIVVTAGVFNRPTFVLFATPPVLFWLQLDTGFSARSHLVIFRRLMSLVPVAFATATCFSLVDTFYYKSIDIQQVYSGDQIVDILSNLVLTPYNFIRYNMDVSNLEIHGLHPRFLHILINVPLIFGILGVLGVWKFWKALRELVAWHWGDQLIPIRAMMFTSFMFPILMLSIFPHQEPRFLVPVLLPLTFLCAEEIAGNTTKQKCLFSIWMLGNVCRFVFFALFHQGGLIYGLFALNEALSMESSAITSHIIFYHTYMPPRHLLTLPTPPDEAFRRVYIHDLAGSRLEVLQSKLTELLEPPLLDKKIYIFAPCTLRRTLQAMNRNSLFMYRFSLLERFVAHFSSEDPPDIRDAAGKFLQWAMHRNYTISNFFFDIFSLHLYQVLPVTNSRVLIYSPGTVLQEIKE